MKCTDTTFYGNPVDYTEPQCSYVAIKGQFTDWITALTNTFCSIQQAKSYKS